MPLSVGIAGFHAQSQGAEHVFRVLQFVGELLEFQQGIDPGEEFFGEDGFVEEIVGPSLDAAQLVGAVSQTGDHDDRNEARVPVLLQLMAQFVTRFTRQYDVQQNQARGLALDLRLGLFRAGGDAHVQTAQAQQLLHQRGVVGIVLHYEDVRLLARGPAPAASRHDQLPFQGRGPGFAVCILSVSCGGSPQGVGFWAMEKLRLLTISIILSLAAVPAEAAPHAVLFGNPMTVPMFLGASQTQSLQMTIRTLSVDGHLREFTTGEPHNISNTLFVVRKAYRVNDWLPEDQEKAEVAPPGSRTAHE